jgi:hypothetical protein
MDWTKGPTPQDVTGNYFVVWEKVEGEARGRYLERRQVGRPRAAVAHEGVRAETMQ